jgi:hypothetical protein
MRDRIGNLLRRNVSGLDLRKPLGERYRGLAGTGSAIPGPLRVRAKIDEVLEQFARIVRARGCVFIGPDAEELAGIDAQTAPLGKAASQDADLVQVLGGCRSFLHWTALQIP